MWYRFPEMGRRAVGGALHRGVIFERELPRSDLRAVTGPLLARPEFLVCTERSPSRATVMDVNVLIADAPHRGVVGDIREKLSSLRHFLRNCASSLARVAIPRRFRRNLDDRHRQGAENGAARKLQGMQGGISNASLSQAEA